MRGKVQRRHGVKHRNLVFFQRVLSEYLIRVLSFIPFLLPHPSLQCSTHTQCIKKVRKILNKNECPVVKKTH